MIEELAKAINYDYNDLRWAYVKEGRKEYYRHIARAVLARIEAMGYVIVPALTESIDSKIRLPNQPEPLEPANASQENNPLPK